MNKLSPISIAAAFAVGVAGFIRMDAHKLDGTSREVAPWFKNLIVDAGLNRMGTGSWMDFCQVGTSSTAPANSDTALVTRVAGTSTIQAQSTGTAGSAPYYGFQSKTFRFALGAAAGNLTEVGFGWALTGSLFNRALIKDGGGSPTTVVVAADEVLDVTYEFRTYAPTSDTTTVVTIAGVDYTFTGRASQVTTTQPWAPQVGVAVSFYNPGSFNSQAAYNGAIAAVTALPSGTSALPSNVTASAYSNNSLARNFQVTFDLNFGNLAGGISAFVFGTTIGQFQFGLNTPLPKTLTKILTMNWTMSWARHP